jgi:hypothetical protein
MPCSRLFRSISLFGLGVFLLGFFVISSPVHAQTVTPFCQSSPLPVSPTFDQGLNAAVRLGVLASNSSVSLFRKAPVYSSHQMNWTVSPPVLTLCIVPGADVELDGTRQLAQIYLSAGRFLIFHGFCLLMTFLFCMK